jgi:hypothetical protein
MNTINHPGPNTGTPKPERRTPAISQPVKRTSVKTFSPRALIRAAFAAAAVPAMLFLGVGTSHADRGDLADPHALTIGWSPWHNGVHNGLTVHIRNNRSTDAGFCVYTADWYVSPPFYLAADSTYNLVIAPSFPENRNWNVNVDCGDGQWRHDQVFYY